MIDAARGICGSLAFVHLQHHVVYSQESHSMSLIILLIYDIESQRTVEIQSLLIFLCRDPDVLNPLYV